MSCFLCVSCSVWCSSVRVLLLIRCLVSYQTCCFVLVPIRCVVFYSVRCFLFGVLFSIRCVVPIRCVVSYSVCCFLFGVFFRIRCVVSYSVCFFLFGILFPIRRPASYQMSCFLFGVLYCLCSPVANVVLIVAVGDGRENLRYERCCIPFAVPSFLWLCFLDDAVKQLAAAAQLGHLSSMTGCIITVTLWWLHYDGYTMTATLWRLHADGYMLSVTCWRLHADGYMLTVALLRLSYDGDTTMNVCCITTTFTTRRLN